MGFNENWFLFLLIVMAVFASDGKVSSTETAVMMAPDMIPEGTMFVSSISAGNPLYTILLFVCRLLGLDEPPVEKACWQRCLAMDGGKARRLGAAFDGTAEGFARCLAARNK